MDRTMKLAEDLKLETGFLCLDFANTLDWHASEHPEEKLFNYGDLVTWTEEVGVLDASVARALRRRAEASEADAARVYERAIALREAIYRIFSAIADRRSPAPADLALLNGALGPASAHHVIVETDDGFRWAWTESAEGELDQMLWPIVRSAADLLTSDDLDRVRECADEQGCGFLFFDMSRNRSRKWCDMETCGNRAKARRHYHRVLSESG